MDDDGDRRPDRRVGVRRPANRSGLGGIAANADRPDYLTPAAAEAGWLQQSRLFSASYAAVDFSLSIVIPAYNEASRLPRTLRHVLSFIHSKGWTAEVIVVNDGSTDQTAEEVKRFSALHESVVLVDNRVNRGKGSAIRDGVLRASGEVILFTDADDSTPIEAADKLLAEIAKGADIVIGSRWLKQDLQTQPQPWNRRLNGRIYNLLLRCILGLNLTDTQNGFKVFTREAGRAVFFTQKIPGWGFDAESLLLAKLHGFAVREVPVEYVYCANGSKIRPYRDGARMLMELLLVKWHFLTGGYGERVQKAKGIAAPLTVKDLGESPASEQSR